MNSGIRSCVVEGRGRPVGTVTFGPLPNSMMFSMSFPHSLGIRGSPRSPVEILPGGSHGLRSVPDLITESGNAAACGPAKLTFVQGWSGTGALERRPYGALTRGPAVAVRGFFSYPCP